MFAAPLSPNTRRADAPPTRPGRRQLTRTPLSEKMSDQKIKDAISGFVRRRDFQVTQISEDERRTPGLLAIRGCR